MHWLLVAENNVALEGPYECESCGGHVSLDCTYLDQVDGGVKCPYCGEYNIITEVSSTSPEGKLPVWAQSIINNLIRDVNDLLKGHNNKFERCEHCNRFHINERTCPCCLE